MCRLKMKHRMVFPVALLLAGLAHTGQCSVSTLYAIEAQTVLDRVPLPFISRHRCLEAYASNDEKRQYRQLKAEMDLSVIFDEFHFFVKL